MLLSYALASLTVFLLVVALWQGLVGRVDTDPVDRRAALRTSGAFAGAALVTGVGAGVVRLLA